MNELHLPDPVIFSKEELPIAIAQYSGLIGQLASRLIIEGRNPVDVEDDVLLNIKEATAMLRCSKSYLYQRVKTLPFTKHVGRKLLFSKKGIQAWIAKRK